MAVTASTSGTTVGQFLRRLASSKKSVLLLDYDGTLAPFHEQRFCAVPYPGVRHLLQALITASNTRVVIVSGRSAREIPPLLGMAVEVWGSHGMEHLAADGEYRAVELDARLTDAFSRAADQLQNLGLGDRTEMKSGSLAVHWRGLEQEVGREIYTDALRVMQPIAFSEGLAIIHFDGGIELRVKTPNKADVVEAILKQENGDCPIAYLGDDITDEDAFTELNPFGLTLLVRQEYRRTAAQFWIRPPLELISFLENWLRACGGNYDYE